MAGASKRDLRQEVTDQIIRALEQGTAPWQKPWQAGVLEMPFNPVSGKPYRGGNVVQLMVVASSHGYDDPRWVTYRQAHETGWQVRHGEKGTQIEFWQFPNSVPKPDGDSKSGPARSERDSFVYRNILFKRVHDSGTDALLIYDGSAWRIQINLPEPSQDPATIVGLAPNLDQGKALADNEVSKQGRVCNGSCQDWSRT